MNRVEIAGHFTGLIDLVRGALNLQTDAPIPAVEDAEVSGDMFWDEWFDPVLKGWNWQTRHDLLSFFREETRLHSTDAAVRFAAILAYDALVRYLTSSPEWRGFTAPVEPPQDGSPAPERLPGSALKITCLVIQPPLADCISDDLKWLVRFVEVDEISDWRTLAWEILNSCMVDDWDRAFRLYDHAGRLRVVDPSELQLLLAQFRYLIVFCEHTPVPDWKSPEGLPFVHDFRKRDRILHPFNWDPRLYVDNEDTRTSLLLSNALRPRNVSTEGYEPEERVLLTSAIGDLESVRERGALPATYRAILARCYLAAGRVHEAVSEYERLLEEPLGHLRIDAYRAAAASYRWAGETKRAVQVLQRCSDEFPRSLAVYMDTAEMQAQESDYEAACATIRKAIDLMPEADTDWRLSALVALADTRLSRDPAFLSNLIKAHPEIFQPIECLLVDYWPRFSSLALRAKDKWLCGAHWGSIPTATEEDAKRKTRESASYYAEAVEIELKEKLFMPFVEANAKLLSDPNSASCGHRKMLSTFRRLKRLEMGKMCVVLGEVPECSGAVCRQLKDWVGEHCAKLLDQLEHLKLLVDVRNAAVHDAATHDLAPRALASAQQILSCIQTGSERTKPT